MYYLDSVGRNKLHPSSRSPMTERPPRGRVTRRPATRHKPEGAEANRILQVRLAHPEAVWDVSESSFPWLEPKLQSNCNTGAILEGRGVLFSYVNLELPARIVIVIVTMPMCTLRFSTTDYQSLHGVRDDLNRHISSAASGQEPRVMWQWMGKGMG